MSLPAGTHTLGPENGTLSVRTGRTGAAAKAGHDLLIHVGAWQATLEVGEDPAQTSIVLDVDPTSLRVREGTGGMQPLGADDKANIETTIDDEVLKGQAIEFRSTAVQPAAGGSRLSVRGELTLFGETRPIAFDLLVGDGTLSEQRRRQAERMGHHALLGAVRRLEGRRRGRGRAGRRACCRVRRNRRRATSGSGRAS